MTTLLYDDTYAGPRYRYGLAKRPLNVVHVGWIIFSAREHWKYRYGTVDYPLPLSDDDVYSYDLELVAVIPTGETTSNPQ